MNTLELSARAEWAEVLPPVLPPVLPISTARTRSLFFTTRQFFLRVFPSPEVQNNLSLSVNMADALKAEGNKAFTEKNFDEAMYVTRFSCLLYYLLTRCSEKFTQAIEIEPQNHVLYSNRSGAYASKKDFDQALEDANKTTEIKPNWAKGWSRKGSALHGTGDLGMSELSWYTPKMC